MRFPKGVTAGHCRKRSVMQIRDGGLYPWPNPRHQYASQKCIFKSLEIDEKKNTESGAIGLEAVSDQAGVSSEPISDLPCPAPRKRHATASQCTSQ